MKYLDQLGTTLPESEPTGRIANSTTKTLPTNTRPLFNKITTADDVFRTVEGMATSANRANLTTSNAAPAVGSVMQDTSTQTQLVYTNGNALDTDGDLDTMMAAWNQMGSQANHGYNQWVAQNNGPTEPTVDKSYAALAASLTSFFDNLRAKLPNLSDIDFQKLSQRLAPAISVLLIGIIGAGLIPGCGKKAPTSNTTPAASASASASASAAVSASASGSASATPAGSSSASGSQQGPNQCVAPTGKELEALCQPLIDAAVAKGKGTPAEKTGDEKPGSSKAKTATVDKGTQTPPVVKTEQPPVVIKQPKVDQPAPAKTAQTTPPKKTDKPDEKPKDMEMSKEDKEKTIVSLVNSLRELNLEETNAKLLTPFPTVEMGNTLPYYRNRYSFNPKDPGEQNTQLGKAITAFQVAYKDANDFIHIIQTFEQAKTAVAKIRDVNQKRENALTMRNNFLKIHFEQAAMVNYVFTESAIKAAQEKTSDPVEVKRRVEKPDGEVVTRRTRPLDLSTFANQEGNIKETKTVEEARAQYKHSLEMMRFGNDISNTVFKGDWKGAYEANTRIFEQRMAQKEYEHQERIKEIQKKEAELRAAGKLPADYKPIAESEAEMKKAEAKGKEKKELKN